MPRGPNNEWRPADTVSRAVLVAKIATGEVEEPDGPPPRAERTIPAPAARQRRPREAPATTD